MPSRSRSETRTPPAHHQLAGDLEEGSRSLERKWLMEAALSGLAARDREILTRFYVGEQSQEQICAEMGITETQFRLLKSRVRAKFEELSRDAIGRAVFTRRRRGVVDIDRLVPIVAHAIAVFGDEQKASHWLATPLPLLGSRSPVQVLARGGDVEAIDQILTRIEHNIPS